MQDKNITNILLAIIAGVLLFGKEAMVGGLKSIAILIALIFAVYVFLIPFTSLIKSIIHSYREAKNYKEAIFLTFGIFAATIFICLFMYSGWLWSTGVEHPFDASFDTWIGTAWAGVILTVIGGFSFIAMMKTKEWLSSNWRSWPNYLVFGTRYISTIFLAPFIFPVREWRLRRAEGSGIFISLFSSIYAILIGLAFFGFSLMPLFFVLTILGIIK